MLEWACLWWAAESLFTYIINQNKVANPNLSKKVVLSIKEKLDIQRRYDKESHEAICLEYGLTPPQLRQLQWRTAHGLGLNDLQNLWKFVDNYRHSLTPEQMAERLGKTVADVLETIERIDNRRGGNREPVYQPRFPDEHKSFMIKHHAEFGIKGCGDKLGLSKHRLEALVWVLRTEGHVITGQPAVVRKAAKKAEEPVDTMTEIQRGMVANPAPLGGRRRPAKVTDEIKINSFNTETHERVLIAKGTWVERKKKEASNV